MSIWTNLFTGTSGLNAHANGISVVGDNIANVSTVGFKGSQAGFADIMGGHIGSSRVGAGVRMDNVQTRFGQGSLQQTGGMFDVAIRGNGFFVVDGNHNGTTGSYYSRDGRFGLDDTGFLVNQEGLRVQGYSINGAGTQSTQLGDLDLTASQTPPVATTAINMAINLDSGAVTPAAFDVANPDTTSNYGTSVTVYDSLGESHQVNLYFRNAGAGSWEVHGLVDGGELTGGTAGTMQEVVTGTLTFNSDGALTAEALTANTANFLNATAGQTLAFDFGDDTASGGTGLAGTTQFAGPSSVTSVDQDGYGFGDLVDVVIAEDGTMTGVFSNGQRRDVARLALATFAADSGLQRVGSALFAETSDSGQPLVDAVSTGNRGAVSAGTVETSNVDIGTELVTMIAYQRAFQANSKTITTADEMLAEVSSLKR